MIWGRFEKRPILAPGFCSDRGVKKVTIMKPARFLVLLLLAVLPSAARDEGQAPPRPKEKISDLTGEPADHYYQGWLELKEGEKCQEAGDLQHARLLYGGALKRFLGVRKQWPDWKKDMVGKRISHAQERLEDLEKKMK